MVIIMFVSTINPIFALIWLYFRWKPIYFGRNLPNDNKTLEYFNIFYAAKWNGVEFLSLFLLFFCLFFFLFVVNIQKTVNGSQNKLFLLWIKKSSATLLRHTNFNENPPVYNFFSIEWFIWLIFDFDFQFQCFIQKKAWTFDEMACNKLRNTHEYEWHHLNMIDKLN